ncbi:hypothetical protein FZEAL_9176 [Fusarium zealandicum]|uniref:Uncharacterized protein n=1 Tax=Fusarium zealandicum TaxID=1053134 RepID=A0A8H4UCE9_9HYPO|nr:hypothetical protein FZEAL_9176 [Fusarium zealandicum]
MVPGPGASSSNPTPKPKRGPKPKPLSERKQKPFSPVKRKEESHSHAKKVRVLLYLLNHRIYDPKANTRGSQRARPVDGYRPPYISEAAAWSLVKKNTIHGWWKKKDKILGVSPTETPSNGGTETPLMVEGGEEGRQHVALTEGSRQSDETVQQ